MAQVGRAVAPPVPATRLEQRGGRVWAARRARGHDGTNARVPTETSDPWSPMQISAEALWRRGPYSYVQRLASTRTTGRRTASFDNSLIG